MNKKGSQYNTGNITLDVPSAVLDDKVSPTDTLPIHVKHLIDILLSNFRSISKWSNIDVRELENDIKTLHAHLVFLCPCLSRETIWDQFQISYIEQDDGKLFDK